MKHFCIFIVLAVILMSIFSGCSNSKINNDSDINSNSEINSDNKQNELTDIMICDLSLSVPELKLDREYSNWSSESYIDPNQPKIRIVNLFDSIVKVKYDFTYPPLFSYEVAHNYWDDNNNNYTFNSDGNLIYYSNISSKADSVGQVKSQEECEEIAYDLISERWDVHIDDYTKTVSYDETRKVYTVSYVKYIGDVETVDKAKVEIKETGEIRFFRFDMFGKVSENDVPEFNWEEIKNKITARLDTETEKARKVYDDVKYENFSYYISMSEPDEYVLICNVTVSCINYIGEYTEHGGELITFVAPLK